MDVQIEYERWPLGRIPICHVQVLPLMSGTQRSMLQIFDHLDERFEPHVVCKEAGPLTDELARRGVRYHLISWLDRPVNPVKDFLAYRALRRLFEAESFQLVHSHSSKPGILSRLAACQAGVPAIIHHVRGFAFHEFSPRYKRFLFSRLEKWVGRYSDRVIFVNDEERCMSISRGWLPAEKCVTILNGVDLSLFDAGRRGKLGQRAQLAEGDREVRILVLGRFEEQKQPLLVPEIAAELERLRPKAAWRILQVGAGPLQASLESLIRRSRQRHRIRLLGWSDQPHKALMNADIVLHPSLWEGLPRTLIEAQAASLPIVASDVKGNREVVTEETGFLCAPRNASDYANRLAQLIDDHSLRNKMGAAARRRAEAKFNSVTNNKLIMDLYCQLLSLPATGARLTRAA